MKAAKSAGLPFDWSVAVEHLAAQDARLAPVIAQVGARKLELDGLVTTFEALARAIVYQQLTGKAAATIHTRVTAHFPRRRLKPELLLALPDEALRTAGLSGSKVMALRDLAARTLDGSVPSVGQLRTLTDEEIIERLVAVRGIGRWSVEMLLIFRLGRPDVLPAHDYGVRQGLKVAYGKRKLPTPKEVAQSGELWRPFRTVASWYLWRALDLARAAEKEAAAAPSEPAKAPPARRRLAT